MCHTFFSTYSTAIISSASAIIAGFGGQLIGQYQARKTAKEISNIQFANSKKLFDEQAVLTKERDDIATRRIAAAKFRAAFAPAIAEYRIITDKAMSSSIISLLGKELHAQAAAIEEFRPFVAPEKIEAYQKAWEDYHIYGGNIRFEQYYMDSEPEKCKELFKTRINAILEFANG